MSIDISKLIVEETAARVSDVESEDSDSDTDAFRFNCDQIRTKIQEYLKTSTADEFTKKISVNEMDLKRFLSYKGPKIGQSNPIYSQANKLFDSIDKQNVKIRHDQKRVKAIDNDYVKKILAIDLPYSEKIFEDCDYIRKKINDFIDSKIATKTDMTRILDINSNSLRTFSIVNGPKKGAGNCTYLKAYRFFEQERILNNVEKSALRLETEAKMPKGYDIINEKI